jgi:GntR family transcriptional regulator / MocR family aminotransferase
MPHVAAIYRYPIKGLSPQPLTRVELEAGEAVSFDRVFALARPGGSVDPAAPKWAKKSQFVMMMLDDGLAELKTDLDVATRRFTVKVDDDEALAADLDDERSWPAVEAFFQSRVPGLQLAPRLVRSRDGHFCDKPDNLISLINLATIRSLEAQWGYAIDPLRFRANIYVDGVAPWAEFDWVGQDIRLGDAVCTVDRRNGRCAATNVDPTTGKRDLNIPGSLHAAFGHKDLGVYLVTRIGGGVKVGDAVEPPRVETPGQMPAPIPPTPPAAQNRFVCRGCYFVYDEAAGLSRLDIAPGTAFAAIPPSWRCPDCGTDKTNFRPQVAPTTRGGAA